MTPRHPAYLKPQQCLLIPTNPATMYRTPEVVANPSWTLRPPCTNVEPLAIL